MKTIKIEGFLTYDDEIMHHNNEESYDRFVELLMGDDVFISSDNQGEVGKFYILNVKRQEIGNEKSYELPRS